MKSPRLFILFVFLVAVLPAVTQDEPLAPEFLLRQDNQLLLINGYTGETTAFPIELGERDKVEWSPDGTYIIVENFIDDGYRGCLNLYAVDLLTWISTEPISCDVKEVLLTAEDSHLFYITTGKLTDSLWLFDVDSKSTRKLYETNEGGTYDERGFSSLALTPNQQYLFFREYDWLMGGTDNYLVVMNLETYTHITVTAPDPYYADYNPIWSSDEAWFLIKLRDEYIVSFSVPRTNHQGDVYLINANDGEQHRITYTPTIEERNIRWTNEGEIAFTEVIMRGVTLKIEEAQAVEPVPFEDIVQPEEVDYPNFEKHWVVRSPDPTTSAWFGSQDDEEGNTVYTIKIGVQFPENVVYSAASSEQLQTDAIAIGWRPTDVVYPQD